MQYEDTYGHIVDTEKIYTCRKCGWSGTVLEMDADFDCGDEYDALYSDYCCPKCWTFYSFITDWDS